MLTPPYERREPTNVRRNVSVVERLVAPSRVLEPFTLMPPERLNTAERRAEPTGSRLERLHAVIDQAKQRNCIDDIRSRWDDLDAKATRASDLCVALDQLADVSATLEVSRSPRAAQLAEHLRRMEGVASVEMNRATASLDGPGLEL